jgi:signal peptidase I
MVLEIVAIMAVLSVQPYRPVVFMGKSMAPTYADRELVLASTEVGQISRGDIVVIDKQGSTIIKRVAYVEGDSINYYLVGNEWLCGLETTFDERVLDARFPRRQVPIPPGFVFVLGDNLRESLDSREFGFLPVKSITAKLPNARPRVPSPNEKTFS